MAQVAHRIRYAAVAALAASVLAVLGAACGGNEELVVYSGRSPELIGPLLDRFAEERGISVAVRYGSTAQLAALLIEEGDRTPADVYIAQDAGALGAVQARGLFAPLDGALLELVDPLFRSRDGAWVGLSGRVRVIVYNTEAVDPAELPASILDFAGEEWAGRVGWAPQNGSFQAWVTALRLTLGEAAARAWLEAMAANEPVELPNNVLIVDAVGRGEIEVGFVNHYYLGRFLAEQGEDFPARNHYTAPGDVGTLVNVAGAGVLRASERRERAEELIAFLLSPDSQRHLAEVNAEYPLLPGVPSSSDLPTIAELQPLDVDLSGLEDLEGTLQLLRATGVLP
ncbi:MAG: iron ABC transporter substrate-binding protein [Chloroflexi bacterium]|nr:iron ABC transporter substrate-binding protein [Chloroflexota bacterium]